MALRRSAAGVYKILKLELVDIRPHRKVDESVAGEIQLLYFRRGLAASEVAKELRISKQTVLYWLRKGGYQKHSLSGAQSLAVRVNLASGMLDLKPFVEPDYLRWYDEDHMILRKANSKAWTLSRWTSAPDFFQLVGFYLAEGAKTMGGADLVNTNHALIDRYHNLGASFIKSVGPTRWVGGQGVRKPKWRISFGGKCVRIFFLNAIDGILAYLEGVNPPDREARSLGLKFLVGCSDGDGSIATARQPKTEKWRMELRITENRSTYAFRLRSVLRNLLGVGMLYKPLRRNYYEVIATLNPRRAALMLVSGFFTSHPNNRSRLATKALDSAYIQRYVVLYRFFGTRSFSLADLGRDFPAIHPDFVGRACGSGEIVPVGVVKPRLKGGPHWYRSYTTSRDTQILARMILESIRDGPVSSEGNVPKLRGAR